MTTMLRVACLGLGLSLSAGCLAQKKALQQIRLEECPIVITCVTPPEPLAPPPPVIFADPVQMAEFPGDIRQYIDQNIKYPDSAFHAGIEGRVFVRFTVEANGNISDITVVRSVHKLLDDEAVRLVKAMPAWKPSRLNGKPLTSQYILPVIFWLEDAEIKK